MSKILIIDDEVDMCNAISNILQAEGYKTIYANDGNSGLNKVDAEKPDIVLLDMKLPGMDGLEILKKIKAKYSLMPVVMITGYGNVNSAVELMKMGASDYISKPFDNDKIVATVAKALGINNSINELEAFGFRGIDKNLNWANTGGVDNDKRSKSRVKRKNIDRKLIISIIGIFILSISIFAGLKLSFKKTASYEIPYSHISAITYDGKNIWITDWFGQAIYKHNLDGKLSVSRTFHLPNIHPVGLAYDGRYFWVTDNWTRKIYKLANDENMTIISEYTSPGQSPGAIMWDGRNIWTTDAAADKIYRHNMDSGLTVSASYSSPSTNPSGLAWDGKNVWSCDADANRIYLHNMDSTLSIAGMYELPEFKSNMTVLSGFCWDGRSFWACSEGLNRVYRYNLFDIKVRNIYIRGA